MQLRGIPELRVQDFGLRLLVLLGWHGSPSSSVRILATLLLRPEGRLS